MNIDECSQSGMPKLTTKFHSGNVVHEQKVDYQRMWCLEKLFEY